MTEDPAAVVPAAALRNKRTVVDHNLPVAPDIVHHPEVVEFGGLTKEKYEEWKGYYPGLDMEEIMKVDEYRFDLEEALQASYRNSDALAGLAEYDFKTHNLLIEYTNVPKANRSQQAWHELVEKLKNFFPDTSGVYG